MSKNQFRMLKGCWSFFYIKDVEFLLRWAGHIDANTQKKKKIIDNKQTKQSKTKEDKILKAQDK